MERCPKIAWVTRSFLDYRIPVFKALDSLVNGNLYLIYSGDYVPESVQVKVGKVLGERAIAMHGEWKLGAEDRQFMANANVSLRFQPGLYGKIKSISPDVLICDGFFKWTLSALLYRLFNRVPLVINYERTFHTERNVQWYRDLYRKLVVKFIDAMNCNGVLCKEYTLSLGMPVDRIMTGHMVADTVFLEEKRTVLDNKEILTLKQELGVHGIVYLYVGRIHQLKGCKKLLLAWSRFDKMHAGSATLLLVGDGEQRKELMEICDEFEISSVIFAGKIPFDDLANFYALADIFIIPTLEDNWSLVVPEAMACALPILCSKYNGCWPELVHEGENGWVFDPLDKMDILRVLQLCYDRQANLKEMGNVSLEIIKDHSPQDAAESILSTCGIALDQ